MAFEFDRECRFCKKDIRIRYSEDHDAYFCPECKGWAENKCSDKDCEFCPTRPLKAQEIANENRRIH